MHVRILLVDDEDVIRITLQDALEAEGHEVVSLCDGLAALTLIESSRFDVVITDLHLPGADGMQVVRTIREKSDETFIVVITAFASIESAIDAMKCGANEYLRKPFVNEEVIVMLHRMAKYHDLEHENARLKKALGDQDGVQAMIGTSPGMEALFNHIRHVAPTNTSVLIYGESGTGKQLVADAIHRQSRRKEGPYVKVACALFPENLLEDELFGHEKGAFTNAHKKKPGRFELAKGGTIFLDDIDDMPLNTQVKLLRILQEREFERLGGTETIKADIRVVAASKVDLQAAVERGHFRKDLYYRLKVVNLMLPPLRERKEDISELIRFFLKKYGKGIDYEIAPEVIGKLRQYDWPGNVRELENAVEAAIALSGGNKSLDLADFVISGPLNDVNAPSGRTLRDIVAKAEAQYIREVLVECRGNRTRASEILGVSRKTLWERIKFYQIEI